MEPVFLRKARKGRANAALKEPLEIPEDQEIVLREVEKNAEASDGEEINSDIVVDESKAEEYVSRANFGGRFTRKK